MCLCHNLSNVCVSVLLSNLPIPCFATITKSQLGSLYCARRKLSRHKRLMRLRSCAFLNAFSRQLTLSEDERDYWDEQEW